jgi:phosphoesterase RecJ-like protein
VTSAVTVTATTPSEAVLAPFRSPRGRALMLGHVHPDADVLGTLLALGQALEARGWRVTYGGPHPAPAVLAFLPGVERYQRLHTLDGRFDVAVLTDCPNPERTEGLIDQARRAVATVVNIDHHPDNRRYGDVNWIDVSAAATGELVYELLVALGAPLTPPIATNLFTALHTDTGSFRYSNVTPRTFKTAAALVQAGAEPAFVSERLYERRAPDALRWLGEALGRVEISDDGRLAWLALPGGSIPEKFIESEELVNYPRSVATVRVACLLREDLGRVKVSLRGKGDVDVQRIAAQFGGGGHPNAAGCTIAGPLAEATRVVLVAVRAALAAASETPGAGESET